MAGVILENISTKKLVLICLFLFGLSLTCFIIGGAKVPDVAHTQNAMGNWCYQERDDTAEQKEKDWYTPRAFGNVTACNKLSGMHDAKIAQLEPSQIVFSFQYPLPRGGKELAMSRWFMYHVTVLSFNINYQEENNPQDGALLGLKVKVGYKSINDSGWSFLLEGDLERVLRCEEPEKKEDGYQWNCDFLDLFEIGNMHHDQYLVNIRLPPNHDTGHNIEIGHLAGIDLVWFAQTGGFTLYFLVLKTVCFALVLPLTVWNWKRVADLNRPAVFLEKLLLCLASSAIVLNLPVDWLVLVTEMKFMLLWSDIRQGIFLSVLLVYWLIFTGEHMVDDVKRGQWTSYWKQLATVILASSLMFIFDICERGVRMANPFFSLWSTEQGSNVGKAFIGIAIAAAILYVLILVGFIIKAIYNIWKKKAAFKSMAKGLRIHYMSVIYRFFFMLIFSGVCSMLTVTAFAMGQIYESQWKWDFDDDEEYGDDDDTRGYLPSMKDFKINTAFQLGMYGTWNVYVMAMLIFYAPSHKKPANVLADEDDENEERVELTAINTGRRPGARTAAAASIEQTDETTDETVNLTTGHAITPEGVSHIHTLANKAVIE